MRPAELPAHGALSRAARLIEAASLIAAAALVLTHAGRLAAVRAYGVWWAPVVILAALVAADFCSGLVHWVADTWGHESLPLVGPRFIRPFRVHHVNPADFLTRDFVDCNGDVAMAALPGLVAAWWIPLDSPTGQALALFVVAFLGWTLPTNQVHQWAHGVPAPRGVVWLQRCRLVLDPVAHDRHHRAPYTAQYCILTGWCNGPLTAVGFFPALERAITALTGWQPREDDASFATRETQEARRP